jgi:predicted GNAT family acetyltransferase
VRRLAEGPPEFTTEVGPGQARAAGQIVNGEAFEVAGVSEIAGSNKVSCRWNRRHSLEYAGTVAGVTTLRPAAVRSMLGSSSPGPSSVEPLADRSRRELEDLLDLDPIVNAALSARLDAANSLVPGVLGGQIIGVRRRGALVAAVFNGGNVLPIGGDPAAWEVLAAEIASSRRLCTSIVGRNEAVAAMWQVLARSWGPARAVRPDQPLLVIDDPRMLPAGDVRVRAIRAEESEAYLLAAAAMFHEELGISPLRERGGATYRRRIGALIAARHAFGIVDEAGRILFKADLGAISAHTCQLQGVWVTPSLRGRGLGTAALASVVRHALTIAPTVSLYVNGFNEPARRVYDRLGMEQIATLSTVLF